MQNSLENKIYLCQLMELQKIGIDIQFMEPHVFNSKLRRTNSKNAIQIFWQNALLLDIKKESPPPTDKEGWTISNASGEVLLEF